MLKNAGKKWVADQTQAQAINTVFEEYSRNILTAKDNTEEAEGRMSERLVIARCVPIRWCSGTVSMHNGVLC
jgi:hypothetical protein